MWDRRVVEAILETARDDLRQQRWARDFADKLRGRGITLGALMNLLERHELVVLYWHRGKRAIGFWANALKTVAVWSPWHPSRWVTAFRHDRGWAYLLSQEDAEILWESR